MAAETNKVFAALKIRLPTSEASVVAEVKIIGKLLCEIFVMTVKVPHVRDDRGVLSHHFRPVYRRWIRDEAAWIGPIWWQRSCTRVAPLAIVANDDRAIAPQW